MMQKKRLLRNQKRRHPQSSRCLGSSQNATRPKQKTSTTSIRQQIIKYKEELSHPITGDTGTDFWLEKSDSFYHSLKPFALDLLAMPASQAFAERVFSITGDLTRGRRNRGRVTLEQSAFLKMNREKQNCCIHCYLQNFLQYMHNLIGTCFVFCLICITAQHVIHLS